jgi:hypothetical protein
LYLFILFLNLSQCQLICVSYVIYCYLLYSMYSYLIYLTIFCFYKPNTLFDRTITKNVDIVTK